MVDTIKFSEFVDGGDLSNNETTVGLGGGTNTRYNNPWTFLKPGTTGDRPAPSAAIYYRLRLNTDTSQYEYYNPLIANWVQLTNGTFDSSPYVIYSADAALTNAFNLGTLTSGILKQTVVAGVATPSIAIAGVDFYGPGMLSPIPIAAGGTGANNAADARTNLGLGTMAIQDANNVNITGGFAGLGAGTIATSPTNPLDITNKLYVDTVAAGFTFIAPCVVATTAALNTTYNNGASGVGATLTSNVNGVLTLDGISPSLAQRVLVHNQSTTFENGIYTVTDTGSAGTPFILTRATDYDTPAKIQAGSIVFILTGTTFANTSFVETSPVVTVGSSPIIFVQFSQTYPLSMGNGGTGANLTPSNGSIVYSTASAMALLATIANGVLRTDSGGIPSISTSLPAGLTIPGYAHSGANSDITSMTALTGYLQAPIGIKDSAGNIVVAFAGVASAVNYLQFSNNITAQIPEIEAGGADTDVSITYRTKNAGAHHFVSNNVTVPMIWNSGTTAQHTTSWSIPNTLASRTITLQDADGTMCYLADRGCVLLSTQTVAGAVSVIFNNLTGYSNYIVFMTDVLPGTNAVGLIMQMSINNGATFVSTASYRVQQVTFVGATVSSASSSGTTVLSLAAALANTGGSQLSGVMECHNFGSSSGAKTIEFKSYYLDSSAAQRIYMSSGQGIITNPVNAIAILPSAGTISGTFQIYGLK